VTHCHAPHFHPGPPLPAPLPLRECALSSCELRALHAQLLLADQRPHEGGRWRMTNPLQGCGRGPGRWLGAGWHRTYSRLCCVKQKPGHACLVPTSTCSQGGGECRAKSPVTQLVSTAAPIWMNAMYQAIDGNPGQTV
jgi:hypothetical protein